MYYVERYVRWCCILNCFMPSSLLVFILFAVLLSLHLHTFLNVFYTYITIIMQGASTSETRWRRRVAAGSSQVPCENVHVLTLKSSANEINARFHCIGDPAIVAGCNYRYIVSGEARMQACGCCILVLLST